jgi:hypothetical protein
VDAAAGAAGAADSGDGAVGSDVADAAPEAIKPDGAQGLTYTFDTSVQGWAFQPFGSTPVGNPASPNNLAVLSTMTWDSADDAENRTTSGSLQGTVPFRADGDRIDFEAFSAPWAKYDWTGYTISAKVKLVSGGRVSPGCPLRAWLYVSAIPNYATTLSAAVDLSTGSWVTLTYDMADAGVDVTLIQQLGIQVTTGAACTADAGTPDGATDAPADAISDGGDAADVAPPTATTAIILIDDVIVSVK